MILNGYLGAQYIEALMVETRQEDSGAWKTCKNIGYLKTKPLNFNHYVNQSIIATIIIAKDQKNKCIIINATMPLDSASLISHIIIKSILFS